MLRAGRALMLLMGIRPDDGNQHKTVVEYTACYLGDEFKSTIAHFDRMRRKRNICMYDAAASISGSEANAALEAAIEFVGVIENKVREEEPQIEMEF